MNKLSEMITKLCPEGVEWRKLGEVAEVGTGGSNGNEATDDGKYPFFIRSQIVKRKNKYEFDEEAIIVPGEGGIGDIYHYVNGKYALHQRTYRIHFFVDNINTKFIYYYFTAFFKYYIQKKALGGTVTSIRKPMLQNFLLPLPPLAIQQAIVGILDTFDACTQKLEAEKTAREKQYAYYRDKLLTFESGVEYVPMSTLMHRERIKGKQYPEITTVYVVSNTKGFVANTEYWDRDLSSKDKSNYNVVFPGMFAYNPARLNISSINWLRRETPGLVSPMYVVFSVDESRITQEFLYLLITSTDVKSQINSQMETGARPRFEYSRWENILLPLPPLAEQERLVAILDKFDALTHDITHGLPAEIEMRKKQYAYYRDKLLTFKQKSPET